MWVQNTQHTEEFKNTLLDFVVASKRAPRCSKVEALEAEFGMTA